jgi:hypothetical protein
MFALPRNRTWGLLPPPILSECAVPLLCKNSFWVVKHAEGGHTRQGSSSRRMLVA